ATPPPSPRPSPESRPSPAPSPLPQATPAAPDRRLVDGFSGIDPAAMDAFERGLGRAQDTLSRDEPRLRRMLQQLDLDSSRLGVLREIQSWIGTVRPDLRRRSEAIRSEHTEWATSSGVVGGLTAFDEELYGKAAHDPDVYAAVAKLTAAVESGDVDKKTVA